MTETENALKERLTKLFEGLEAVEAKELFEELLDNYCYSIFGMPVISEMRKLKDKNTDSVTIQPLGEVGVLLSRFGFEEVSRTRHPKGGVQLILKEITKREHRKSN